MWPHKQTASNSLKSECLRYVYTFLYFTKVSMITDITNATLTSHAVQCIHTSPNVSRNEIYFCNRLYKTCFSRRNIFSKMENLHIILILRMNWRGNGLHSPVLSHYILYASVIMNHWDCHIQSLYFGAEHKYDIFTFSNFEHACILQMTMAQTVSRFITFGLSSTKLNSYGSDIY